MNENNTLDITPQHEIKPRLEWVGRILGMDLYADTQRCSPGARELAEDILKAKLSIDND